ncbi:MAG: hypothetical protein ACOY0T_18100 [Myxococcota bacterium]
MLRITRIDSPSGRVLRLEGRIVGDWVQVLEGELSASHPEERALVLDLAAVEFASNAAVEVLMAARNRGMRIEACSPLLTSLLEEGST